MAELMGAPRDEAAQLDAMLGLASLQASGGTAATPSGSEAADEDAQGEDQADDANDQGQDEADDGDDQGQDEADSGDSEGADSDSGDSGESGDSGD